VKILTNGLIQKIRHNFGEEVEPVNSP